MLFKQFDVNLKDLEYVFYVREKMETRMITPETCVELLASLDTNEDLLKDFMHRDYIADCYLGNFENFEILKMGRQIINYDADWFVVDTKGNLENVRIIDVFTLIRTFVCYFTEDLKNTVNYQILEQVYEKGNILAFNDKFLYYDKEEKKYIVLKGVHLILETKSLNEVEIYIVKELIKELD